MTIRATVAVCVAFVLVASACATSQTPSEDAPADCAALPAPRDPSAGYSVNELPSGSCTSGTTCRLGARRPCPCSSGPVDAYRCTCESGTWSCIVETKGAALCAPCGSDAAADARPD